MREWEWPDAVLLRGFDGITTGAGEGEGGEIESSPKLSGGGKPTESIGATGNWVGSWGSDDDPVGGLALVNG
jgi:hypothetical protein